VLPPEIRPCPLISSLPMPMRRIAARMALSLNRPPVAPRSRKNKAAPPSQGMQFAQDVHGLPRGTICGVLVLVTV
jgi:hypothetical protein